MFSYRPSGRPFVGWRKTSPLRKTEYSCPAWTPSFSDRSMKIRSPSTWTTKPSAGRKAPTTSGRSSPKVAPTWSATPAATAVTSARTSTGTSSPVRRIVTLEDHRGLVHAEDAPQRVTDLAQRHLGSDRGQDVRQQIVLAPGGVVDSREGAVRRRRVPGAAQGPQTLDDGLADRRIQLEEVGGGRLVHHELVHPHHHSLLALHLLLIAVGGFLDL